MYNILYIFITDLQCACSCIYEASHTKMDVGGEFVHDQVQFSTSRATVHMSFRY